LFYYLITNLFSYLNHSLTAQGSNLPFFTQEQLVILLKAECYLQQNTFTVQSTSLEQTIICRQLFADLSQ